MSRRFRLSVALVSLALAPMLQGANAPLGEVVGNVFTSCTYRVAVNFPAPPMTRDFTYEIDGRSAPAREFHLEHNGALLSTIVAHFADGVEEDRSLVEAGVQSLRDYGEVRFEIPVFYDTPRIFGYQMSVGLPDGKLLRGSVYMARHRLYVTKAISVPADPLALRFEQSLSMIDENGTDLDSNPVLDTPTIGESGGLPSRQYDCSNG